MSVPDIRMRRLLNGFRKTKTHRMSKRGRRRWPMIGLTVAAPIAATLALGTVSAQAVHDTGAFELDGNAVNGPAPGDDWDNVCHEVTGSDCSTSNNTSGATAVDWVSEPNLNATIFTGGGSKDPQDINQWAWKDGAGGLPDKDNLLHSFAARYPTSEGQVLYFGSDRLDNSGDAQQGFWFFQNSIALGNNSVGGGSGFTGVHKTGDVLVISDFSNGGTTSTITVYSWDPTCKKTTGTTVGSCGDANLRNNGALNGEFFEGGVDLTALGLGGQCFASVASETRSSTSTTATLKDFILGGFGNCGTTTVTTPQLSDGTTIPPDGVSIGANASVVVQDQAVVTLTGASGVNPTGTVSFHLCGPTPLSDANYTLCATGGTAITPDKTLSGTSNPATVTSNQATVTSVGRYCFRADYSGDPARNISGSSDSSVGECFKILPLQPTLATQAGASSVPLGSPITDTATLGNTANKPGSPVINPTTPG